MILVNARELKEAADGFNVLYIEDDRDLRINTTRLIKSFFTNVVTAENGQEGLDKYREGTFDIVITDINMPVMNGVKMAREIRSENDKQIIIIISAHDEAQYLLDCINVGVDYFILKPLDIEQFMTIIDKAIRWVKCVKLEDDYKKTLEETIDRKTRELKDALGIVENLTNEVVQRLTSAAELRDTDTGLHNKRLGKYAPELARELGLPADFIEDIAFAAPLHDIGKIGIYDNILLKNGPLTKEEFEVMKTHTTTGANILSGSVYSKIQMTESIALTHHERWDGTGYPKGLKGEEIPIEGRITSICDVYDALRSKRPYKPALSHQEAMEIIINGDDKTSPCFFDPKILETFVRIAPIFDHIFVSQRGNTR